MFNGFLGEGFGFFEVIFFLAFGEEVLSEQGDIIFSIAEWRDKNGEDIESEEKVFTEEFFFHIGLEVSVSCGDNADIDFNFFRASDGLDFFFLEYAE